MIGRRDSGMLVTKASIQRFNYSGCSDSVSDVIEVILFGGTPRSPVMMLIAHPFFAPKATTSERLASTMDVRLNLAVGTGIPSSEARSNSKRNLRRVFAETVLVVIFHTR